MTVGYEVEKEPEFIRVVADSALTAEVRNIEDSCGLPGDNTFY